jgi:alpha-beta hydrolase superfamily lysophospholipase
VHDSSIARQSLAAGASAIVPVSFGGHLGAWHRPSGEDRGVAVVICPPLGREARCAYRPLFSWAETLASDGFHVLRYDPLGEGDSAPLDRQAEQLQAWIGGVAAAAEFVRAETGARRLVLAGLRMGGTLALAAAPQVQPDGMLLLAPVPTGEAWLRDLRLAAAIQRAPLAADAGLEVDGLWLSPATVQALQRLDTKLIAPNWRAAFLATPNAGRAFAAQLGPAVTVARFPGYVALFKEAYLNQSPTEVLAEAGAWLDRFAAAPTAAAPARRAPPAQLEGRGWLERPVSFGDGLRGVLCLPTGKSSQRAVLFGNTAADPRAGVGNFATNASRALAARGVAALRFDFAGVGESAGERAEGMDIYAASRLPDYTAAAAVLQSHGYEDLTVIGVCTGGYHAVHAVLDSGQFRRAVAVNSWLVLRWGRSLELRSETASGAPRPSSAPEGASRWSKLLRGDIDARDALRRKARQLWSSLRPDAPCRSVRRRIRSAARDGAEIHLVLGRGDVATQALEADFGLGCGWLRRQRGVSVSLLEKLDHALFSAEAQATALGELFRILNVETAGDGSAAARPSERFPPFGAEAAVV